LLLKGKELSNEEGWMILVVCGVHNHLASEYLEGHFFVVDYLKKRRDWLWISKSFVRPRDILHTLKQRNKLNVSTMMSVYNARKKFKVVKYVGRSQMQ